MANKKWETKMNSLLHSLDISHGSDIDEHVKFGDTDKARSKKIQTIAEKYIISILKEKQDTETYDGSDLDDLSENEALPEFLNTFFDELEHGDNKEDIDPLIDAVITWFQELLMINSGQFKIVKNESGSLHIVFNTDEITDPDKKISKSVTDKLTRAIEKIDTNSVQFEKPKPKKPPIQKKQAVKKNGRTITNPEKQKTTRPPKNKDTE